MEVKISELKNSWMASELRTIVIQDSLGKGYGSALFQKAALVHRAWYKQTIVKTERLNSRAISFYKLKDFVETENTTDDVCGKKVDVVVLKPNLLA